VGHVESCKVGRKGDLDVVALFQFRRRAFIDSGFLWIRHVVTKDLSKLETGLDVNTFDDKLSTEDVGELGTVSVTTTSRLFLVVVKVLSVQEKNREDKKVRCSDNR
jgi:hypothetical protein